MLCVCVVLKSACRFFNTLSSGASSSSLWVWVEFRDSVPTNRIWQCCVSLWGGSQRPRLHLTMSGIPSLGDQCRSSGHRPALGEDSEICQQVSQLGRHLPPQPDSQVTPWWQPHDRLRTSQLSHSQTPDPHKQITVCVWSYTLRQWWVTNMLFGDAQGVPRSSLKHRT